MYLTERDFQEFQEGEGFGDWCGNLLLKVFPDAFDTADIVDMTFAIEMAKRFGMLKITIDDQSASCQELKDTFIIQKVLQPRTTSVMNYLKQYSTPSDAIRNLINDTRDTDTLFPATN